MTAEEKRAYIREWKRRNRERVNAQARARYREKPPDRRESRRRWYHATIEAQRAKARAHQARRRAAGKVSPEDPEKKRARRRRYRAEHLEQERAASAAWRRAKLAEDPAYYRQQYAANRDAILAKIRAYRAENPEVSRRACRRWRAAHPETVAALKAVRRMRERSAPVVEAIDRHVIYARDGGVCHLCRRRVSARSFTLDHLIPLAKGGEHAAFNVAVAHRRCNLRKHARLIPVQVPLPLTQRAALRTALRFPSARASG